MTKQSPSYLPPLLLSSRRIFELIIAGLSHRFWNFGIGSNKWRQEFDIFGITHWLWRIVEHVERNDTLLFFSIFGRYRPCSQISHSWLRKILLFGRKIERYFVRSNNKCAIKIDAHTEQGEKRYCNWLSQSGAKAKERHRLLTRGLKTAGHNLTPLSILSQCNRENDKTNTQKLITI